MKQVFVRQAKVAEPSVSLRMLEKTRGSLSRTCTQPLQCRMAGHERTRSDAALIPVHCIFPSTYERHSLSVLCSFSDSCATQVRNCGFFNSLRMPSPFDTRACHPTTFGIRASTIGNMTSATTSRTGTRCATPVQMLTSRPNGWSRKSRSTSSLSFLYLRVSASCLIIVPLTVKLRYWPA